MTKFGDWVWLSILVFLTIFCSGHWVSVLPAFVAGMYAEVIIIDWKKEMRRRLGEQAVNQTVKTGGT